MNANGINRLGPVCLLIAYCALPAGAIDYTWNLGDTGGNWGDEANWDSGDGTPGNDGFPDDTGDTATLLAPVVARYVTNDAARTIGNLAMGNNANNRLWLEDDLTVDAFNGGTGVRVYVNGHVFTFGNSADIGDPRGGGTIRKVGTGGSSYRYTANFTGDMIIDEGSATLAHNSYSTWNSVHATNSAGTGRLILSSRVLGFPPNIYLMGDGDGSGALFMSDSDVNVDLHLLGDTSIGVASGKTLTIREDIIAEGGAYVLTKRGAGTLEVAYLDGYSFSNMIVVAAGTLEAYSVWNYVTNVTVQSNATLTAVQENFPNADIVVEEGGTWNQSGMPIWKGPAGNNEGGAWSDLSGWTIPFVPTNVAILQAPASTRYVTNLLADRFVNELRMDDNSKNRIRLEADMTVGTLVGGGNNVIDVGTNTLTFYSAAFVGDPMGTGKVIKNGASGTEIRYAGSFAGDMIVNEGSFSMSYTDYSSYKSLRATNSAGYISIIDRRNMLKLSLIYLNTGTDKCGARR